MSATQWDTGLLKKRCIASRQPITRQLDISKRLKVGEVVLIPSLAGEDVPARGVVPIGVQGEKPDQVMVIRRGHEPDPSIP